MPVHIGNKEVIQSFCLMIPSGQDAWVDFFVDDWNVKINIIFETDEDDKKSRFDFLGLDGHAQLKMINWAGKLPAGVEEPILIGEKNEAALYLMISGFSVGGMKRLDLIFMLDEANE